MLIENSGTSEQVMDVVLAILDEAGKPAHVQDDAIDYTVTAGSGSVANLPDPANPGGTLPSAAGFSIVPDDGFEGDILVTGTGDADLGAGVKPITINAAYHVTHPQASQITGTSSIRNK